MQALARKLLRTIKSTLGQFLALSAIVMVGVAIYISMNTAYNNLSVSQQDFYQNYNFADYYFHVVKAPETIVNKVQEIDGVSQAEGRVQKDLTLLKTGGERGTVRISGYRLPLNQGINRVLLKEGRVFEQSSHGSSMEALVDKVFFNALAADGEKSLVVVAEGREVDIDIVGVATTPEFMYAVKDSNNWFPEPGKFGICMIEHQQAQQLLNMQGQVNQVVIKLEPGADEDKVARDIEGLLKPYGFLTSYPQKDQFSNAIVNSELQQLDNISSVMPVIFFLVAAGIQFVILTRLIKNQRRQIGILKGLGYSSRSIILYYTSYALAVSICGTMAGIVFGLMMAQAMAEQYSIFFNLPYTLGEISFSSILSSFVITLAVGALSGFLASLRITRITPAEAMRPEPPPKVHKSPLEYWSLVWKLLSSSLRMSMRSLTRNRSRTVVTIIGIASSVMVVLLAFFMQDCTVYMINRQYEQENMYNYIIHFAQPIKSSEINYWQHWDEVSRLEPRLEVPVKFWKGGQANLPGAQSEDELIIGLPRDCQLKTILTRDDVALAVPDDGIILSQRLSAKLGIGIGDQVQGETRLGIGPDREFRLTVIGFNTQYMGMSSFVSLETANRLLREDKAASAVMVTVDRQRGDFFEERLSDMNNVSSILSKDKELDNLNKLMESMDYYIGIMLLFSMILGVAIVYNSLIMGFTERKRELASMMVLGFHRREIGLLLFNDLAIQSLLGFAVGIPAGRLLGEATMKAMESDIYVLPVVIYPQTYFISIALASLFVLFGYLISMRRLGELDMVETLKDVE